MMKLIFNIFGHMKLIVKTPIWTQSGSIRLWSA